MKAWSEVHATLEQAGYTIEATEPEASLGVTVYLENGRTQQVVVESYRAIDRDWVCIKARVCRADQLDPQWALAANTTLLCGALAVEDDHCVLLQNQMLEPLDEEELLVLVRMIGVKADQLEEQYTDGADVW